MRKRDLLATSSIVSLTKVSPWHWALSVPFFMLLLGRAAVADTEVYEYDELGRLTRVQYNEDGRNTAYVLDSAGNRTQVVTTVPSGAPPSITVPASSATGKYWISWDAASGDLTAYELYEATNSSFSNQVLVHNGTATSKLISGKSDGAYYYRVRACNGSACSDYRLGSNATSVLLAGTPSSITVPSSSTTGSYTITWGESNGTATAYRLYEATNSSFSGQALVHNGSGTSKALSGRGQGTYYYRVRACNTYGCGSYRKGSNGITVTFPPDPPANVYVPSQVYGGNYSVSWSSSAGATRYELWESANFGSFDKIYDSAGTGMSFVGKPSGHYSYKVKACNVAGCSAFSATHTCAVCNPECGFGGI